MKPTDPATPPSSWEQRYLDNNVPWDTDSSDNHLRGFIERSQLAPCRALDVGCGTGSSAIWLHGRGFEVCGVDLSPTAIERARAKATAAGVGCQLRTADFLVDPIDEAGFGLVYDRGCFHVFDQTADRVRFAARVAALLKPDGLWHSVIGSTDGPPGNMGPPRRSALEIAIAVEPHFEILELRSAAFDDANHTQVRGWVMVARRRHDNDALRATHVLEPTDGA